MTARDLGRLPYSRSSMERVGRTVGALYLEHHEDVEGMVIDDFQVPEDARSVSVAVDRVALPMEEPRPRAAVLRETAGSRGEYSHMAASRLEPSVH